MKWITGARSSQRALLITNSHFGVFYPGDLSLNELAAIIETKLANDETTSYYGELFRRSEIEYLAYAPAQKSLKVNGWDGGSTRSRFIHGITPLEAESIRNAVIENWDDFKCSNATHGKFLRIIPYAAVTLAILYMYLVIYNAHEQGRLHDQASGGRGGARLRLIISLIEKFFAMVGKPGITVCGVLSIAFPIVRILKILSNSNPEVEIIQRTDITVTAAMALDRELE